MARAGIAERVAALGDLSRLELIELWVKRYGVEPPTGMRQPMLLRAAAAHVQEKQLGGLSPTGKRLLKSAVNRIADQKRAVDTSRRSGEGDGAVTAIRPSQTEAMNSSASSRAVPLPGARLIREWNGRRYVVEVTDSGFVMDGKGYKSLTAIAFRITGAKWSGPRFFGL